MSSIGRIADVIPADLNLTVAEREAILEVALLSIAADRDINEDELLALRRIAHRLGGQQAAYRAESEVDALLARGLPDREQIDGHLRFVATKLTTDDAKHVAYKAAYALALSDLAAADEEFEFDLQLIDALGLSQDVVDALTGEVVTAIQPEGDDDE